MSDLGYRNKSQAGVQISVNSLEEYVRDLSAAGEHAASGSTSASASKSTASIASSTANLLQIENEYYSYIARSAWRAPASGRLTRCAAAASSTSNSARSTSAHSIRSA
jgi:gamma-glutamylcysteine synthetase